MQFFRYHNFKFWVVLFSLFILTACGDNKPGSSSGGGQKDPIVVVEPLIGPDMNGDTWQGYYRNLHGGYSPMSAVITHTGDKIIIETSLPNTGVAGRLQGRITPSGTMFLYDLFDGEDWTTLYGGASANSINLADFVFVEGQNVDTNIIILKR
ncbi:MAG: hypothetical protein V3V09_07185 [Arenicellales bacterium]